MCRVPEEEQFLTLTQSSCLRAPGSPSRAGGWAGGASGEKAPVRFQQAVGLRLEAQLEGEAFLGLVCQSAAHAARARV